MALKKRVLCIGDSNTWGYIPGVGGRYDEKTRWTGRLACKLGEEYAVIEEGMNGRTTAFDDRIEPGVCALDYLYPCLLSQFPLDGIVIMLGTNDTKTRYHVSAKEIGCGMDEVLLKVEDTCKRKGQNPRILIVAPAPIMPREDWEEFSDSSVRKAALLGREYEEIARMHGCAYLNAAEVVGIGGVGCDGIHLTPEGHSRLADAIAAFFS